MCGIAGIVGPGAAEHRAAVAAMTAALAHRGPDGEGLWVAPSGHCVLGHRRLAILDLTDAAAQPMVTADGAAALTYNGEIYNFRDLRSSLPGDGGDTRSSGDTEVLVRLLAADGVECLPGLNGMFAFAWWDDRLRRLLVARDRFGQKPLYYVRWGGLLLFASEVRALLATGLVDRRLSLPAVAGYLAYGAPQGPETIVDGVRLLPAGSCLSWDGDRGEGRESAFWELPREPKVALEGGEIRDRLGAAVARHLVSDAPIGVFLSGGIDSSAVTAAAVRAGCGDRVRTISVVFPDQPAWSEASHAARMAAHAGTDQDEVPMSGTDLLRLLPSALGAMDQPTMDAVNTRVVSEAARRAGLKVALSGLGGDELFGGYPSFTDVPRFLRWRRRTGWLMSALRSVAPALPGGRRTDKLIELLDAGDSLPALCLARRRLFASRQIEGLWPGSGDVSGRTYGLGEEAWALLSETVSDREVPDAIAAVELSAYMREILLRDSDVMGMSTGLEIRLPFLDTEFSAAALALPSDARRPRAVVKHTLAGALGDWVPPENCRRPKQGFTMPFAAWMTNELRDEVADGLAALAERASFFDRGALGDLWTRFLAAPDRVGWSRPWSLFVLSRYLAANGLAA